MKHGISSVCNLASIAKTGAAVLAIWALSSSPAAGETTADIRMIPWVEMHGLTDVTDPNDPYLAKMIAGLEYWSEIADTAIVTTNAGKSQLYQRLHDALADEGITIIPGLKPSSLEGANGHSFSELDFWQSVAAEVQAIQDVYSAEDFSWDMTECVFECETFLGCYYEDKYHAPDEPFCDCDSVTDLSGFTDGLSQHLAPLGLTYYWHPGVFAAVHPELLENLCQAVEDGLGGQARFDTDRVCKPNRIAGSQEQHAEDTYQRQLAITGLDRPTPPQMFFYSDLDSIYGTWFSNQINEALCHAKCRHGFDQVWIYTGFQCFDGISYDIVRNHYDPNYECDCCPDLDCNGEVDLADLAIVLAAFGSSFGDDEYNSVADLDHDWDVDDSDQASLLAHLWTECGDCWPVGISPDCNVTTSVIGEGDPNDQSAQLTALWNFPNPFNPATNICFETRSGGAVQLVIYDLTGRCLLEKVLTVAPGRASWRWDGRDGAGRDLPSGVYFYHLSGDMGRDSGKLVLAK